MCAGAHLWSKLRSTHPIRYETHARICKHLQRWNRHCTDVSSSIKGLRCQSHCRSRNLDPGHFQIQCLSVPIAKTAIRRTRLLLFFDEAMALKLGMASFFTSASRSIHPCTQDARFFMQDSHMKFMSKIQYRYWFWMQAQKKSLLFIHDLLKKIYKSWVEVDFF